MSETALMMLSGKPVANTKASPDAARAPGEALPTGENGEVNPALFGGLLLKMLGTEGAEQPTLDLSAAAIPLDEAGNPLPPESPEIAWSALMVWDEMPTSLNNASQGTNPLGSGSGATAGVAALGNLPPGALLMRQGNTNEALAALNPSTLDNEASLDQNLLKLMQEQGTQQRHTELRQLANLLATDEPDSGLLTPASTSGSASHSAQFNHLLAGMGALSGAAGAARSDAQLAPMTVAPQHPNWSTGIGERIQWMVGQNMQQAEIRLEPPELGTLELRVTINRDHASLSIHAANAHVRDAVEAAAPRLREMFGDIGLQLGDVNVSQESFAQQQQADGDTSGGASARAGAAEDGEVELVENRTETPLRSGGNGLLDTYA